MTSKVNCQSLNDMYWYNNYCNIIFLGLGTHWTEVDQLYIRNMWVRPEKSHTIQFVSKAQHPQYRQLNIMINYKDLVKSFTTQSLDNLMQRLLLRLSYFSWKNTTSSSIVQQLFAYYCINCNNNVIIMIIIIWHSIAYQLLQYTTLRLLKQGRSFVFQLSSMLRYMEPISHQPTSIGTDFANCGQLDVSFLDNLRQKVYRSIITLSGSGI